MQLEALSMGEFGLTRQECCHSLYLEPNFLLHLLLCPLTTTPFSDLRPTFPLGSFSVPLSPGRLPFSLTCPHNALYCLFHHISTGSWLLFSLDSPLNCKHREVRDAVYVSPASSTVPSTHSVLSVCVCVCVCAHVLNANQDLRSNTGSVTNLGSPTAHFPIFSVLCIPIANSQVQVVIIVYLDCF